MDKCYKDMYDNNNDNLDKKYSFDSNRRFKCILYGCLLKLLREIAFTKDKDTQLKYLQRVYEWFEKKQTKPKGILKNPNTQPKQEALPKFIEKEVYATTMRTIHQGISPPKVQLANYICKNIEKEKKELMPVITKKEYRGKKLSVEFSKIAPIESASSYQYYAPKDPIEQKVERMWFAKKNKDIENKRSSEELYKVLKQWGNAKARLNEDMVRKYENKLFGNNFPIRNANQLKRTTNLIRSVEGYKKIYEEDSIEDGNNSNDDLVILEDKAEVKKPEVIDLIIKVETPPKKKSKKAKSVLPDVRKAIRDADMLRVNDIR